jgi:hypothetical protein
MCRQRPGRTQASLLLSCPLNRAGKVNSLLQIFSPRRRTSITASLHLDAQISPGRACNVHSPGGVHAFLRVRHQGRRMLFIRFVNRAVQALWRSHPRRAAARQEIADIPRFAAPPGDAHRARGSLISFPPQPLGSRPSGLPMLVFPVVTAPVSGAAVA